MGRDLVAEIQQLPPEQRARVEARAEEMEAEIRGLKELRKWAAKSQVEVAKALKTSQPAVSRMERGADMFLSTLRGYVESLGGELELVVRMPDGRELRLEALADLHDDTASSDTEPGERDDAAGAPSRRTG